MQTMVDYFGRMFDEAVAAGRGVSSKVVHETYGQGDMFTPAEALALGMVDSIEPLNDVLGRVAQQVTSPTSRAGRKAFGARVALPTAEAVDLSATDEAEADPAVVEATDVEVSDETRSELEALKDRIALRPHQRRQRGR
jgi:ClpP class serine protease